MLDDEETLKLAATGSVHRDAGASRVAISRLAIYLRLRSDRGCWARGRNAQGEQDIGMPLAKVLVAHSSVVHSPETTALLTLTAPYQMTPNPSIEGTPSGLRPPSAPHVKR
jgi:hypothetical protein